MQALFVGGERGFRPVAGAGQAGSAQIFSVRRQFVQCKRTPEIPAPFAIRDTSNRLQGMSFLVFQAVLRGA
jgi:hypothetical protein